MRGVRGEGNRGRKGEIHRSKNRREKGERRDEGSGRERGIRAQGEGGETQGSCGGRSLMSRLYSARQCAACVVQPDTPAVSTHAAAVAKPRNNGHPSHGTRGSHMIHLAASMLDTEEYFVRVSVWVPGHVRSADCMKVGFAIGVRRWIGCTAPNRFWEMEGTMQCYMSTVEVGYFFYLCVCI